MLHLINRPCRLHTTTTEPDRDGMGDPIVDTDAGTVTVCDLQQETANEDRDGQSQQVSTWTLFLLPGEVVDGWSEVTVSRPNADREDWDGTGDRYTLDGEPWPVVHPRTGVVHHIEARVRKVT